MKKILIWLFLFFGIVNSSYADITLIWAWQTKSIIKTNWVWPSQLIQVARTTWFIDLYDLDNNNLNLQAWVSIKASQYFKTDYIYNDNWGFIAFMQPVAYNSSWNDPSVWVSDLVIYLSIDWINLSKVWDYDVWVDSYSNYTIKQTIWYYIHDNEIYFKYLVDSYPRTYHYAKLNMITMNYVTYWTIIDSVPNNILDIWTEWFPAVFNNDYYNKSFISNIYQNNYYSSNSLYSDINGESWIYRTTYNSNTFLQDTSLFINYIWGVNSVSNLKFLWTDWLFIAIDNKLYDFSVGIDFVNMPIGANYDLLTNSSLILDNWSYLYTDNGINYMIPDSITDIVINWRTLVGTSYVSLWIENIQYLRLSDLNIINDNNYIDSVIFTNWPTILELTASWTIIATENGVQIQNLETNTDFDLTYYVDNITDWIDVVDIWNLWTLTGWLQNIDITYNFTSLVDYRVTFILTDPNDEFNVIFQEYYITYSYNSWYIEPVIEDFSFFSSGFSFLENWFILHNFIPDPYWWELYFEIIAPALVWTWTIDLVTEKFLPYTIDWNWYWFDSAVKITYPYHQVWWTYQVRTLYDFQDLTIYPFWTDYNSYLITVAEIPNSVYEELNPEMVIGCDTDGDWFITTTEQVSCAWNITKSFWEVIWDALMNIKKLFQQLMSIWTDEVKDFSFISWVHASITSDMLPSRDTEADNYLTKMEWFLRGFIYFMFIVIILVTLLVYKNN